MQKNVIINYGIV